MLGGILGSFFDTSNDEFDRKPKNFSGVIEYEIPDGTPPEDAMRIHQHAHDTLRMKSMSKREQLEFLKERTGLR